MPPQNHLIILCFSNSKYSLWAILLHILYQEVKYMAFLSCETRRDCTGIALIFSIIAAIITAFLQITAVITVTPVFLWVVFGIAVAYLALALATTSCGVPRIISIPALQIGKWYLLLRAVLSLTILMVLTVLPIIQRGSQSRWG